jgi:DNA-binding transcriptional LysR family regulator
MRFEQLRYVDAAVRAGTLRKAAEAVGIAQPSLSQQVQKLEEELNLTLLLRSSSGVQPTAACLSLLPQLRAALRAEEALLQEAGAIGGARKGTVRLGAVGWPTRLLLPAVVRSYRSYHPGVDLVAHEGNTQELCTGIVEGDLDVALVSGWGDSHWADDGLRGKDLLPDVHLDLCVPRGHRLFDRSAVNVADMAGEAFIVPPVGHLLRLVFDRVAAQVDVTVSYYTDTSATSLVMVSGGIGVSLLSRYSIVHSRECETGQIRGIPITEDWSTGTLSMISRANEQPPPAVRELMKIVEREVVSFVERSPRPA